MQLWKLWRQPLNVEFCKQWQEVAHEALTSDDVPRIKAYVRCALYKISYVDTSDGGNAECFTTLATMVDELLINANVKHTH